MASKMSARFYSSQIPGFLLGPGKHLKTSPVLGSRCGDLARIAQVSRTEPLLFELGANIYDVKYRFIISAVDREKANLLSRALFLGYIRKYAAQGLDEWNIVNWVTSCA